jgi:hypothetical protein
VRAAANNDSAGSMPSAAAQDRPPERDGQRSCETPTAHGLDPPRGPWRERSGRGVSQR